MQYNTWKAFEAYLSYLMVAFNIFVQRDRLESGTNGRIHCSIAHFIL